MRTQIESAFTLLLSTLFIAGCPAMTNRNHNSSTPLRQAGEYGRVELMRDRWGVPHVFARSDAGAMYGLGFATAEDRAFQMYYNLRIIQGRLAETIGDVKIGVTRQLPQGRNSALRSDVEMRTIGYYRAAQETARQLDPEMRSLLEAYCRGVNDYITRHPNDLLYLFDRYGVKPEPWTPADCIASWWRLGLFFSGNGLNELTAYYEVKDGSRQVRQFAPTDSAGAVQGMPIRDDASVIQRGDVSDGWLQEVLKYAAAHGLTRKVDATAEEADYVNLMLRAARRYGKVSYGDNPSAWNERAGRELVGTKLSYLSTLDGFGSLDEARDVTLPPLRCIDGGTILSQRAQSYTQYVRLDDADLSMSVLPVGQSEHPGSPYHLCNYPLWEQGRLHPAPLSRKAVERIVVSRTTLVHSGR
jgi:acyl-homoserine lactone acylase PvdQ